MKRLSSFALSCALLLALPSTLFASIDLLDDLNDASSAPVKEATTSESSTESATTSIQASAQASSQPKKTSAEIPKLKVTVNVSQEASDELIQKVTQEISLIHLKNDEYPAQTDFLYKRATTELENVLRALGYYKPTVSSQIERSDGLTEAIFNIELGEPVKIRNIDIAFDGEGKDLAVWRQFLKFELTLRKGAIFKHSDYSGTVSALTNLATNEGYMDSEFTQRDFMVYPHLNAVDIHIHLDTKNSYQFGQVRFEGSKQVSKEFLDRFVGFIPGDTYRQDDINALQKSLIDSSYFGLIRVSPQYSAQKNRRIPIEVELEDNLKHRYEIGGGFGSDTGGRVLFGFENRLVNENGHSYQVDSLFGERAQYFNFNYRIPGSKPAIQHWNAGVKYDATQSDILSRSLTAITGDYRYQITPEWLITPFVSLESEDFRYKSSLKINTRTLLMGVGVKNRWVNSESYPTEGFNHNATLRTSIDNLVSESQFTQIELSTSKVFSLMEFWRLHTGLRATLTQAGTNQVIPATYLTLLGGENLRGFKFESIGIKKSDGTTVGARNSLSGTIETDYRITQYFGLGLFTDVGQVFDKKRPKDWKVGAGAGLRGYTPIGMAKFDIAWPVSEDEKDWRLHFSLGFDL